MLSDFTVLPASGTLDELAKTAFGASATIAFRRPRRGLRGGHRRSEPLLAHVDDSGLAQNARPTAKRQFVVISADASLADLLERMDAKGVSLALATDNAEAPSLANTRGIVTEYETAGGSPLGRFVFRLRLWRVDRFRVYFEQ